MANFFPVFILTCTLQLAFTSVCAINEPKVLEKITAKVDYCDAKAPENFQVLSLGSNMVSLGWMPAWLGAIQTLEVSVESSGNWVVLFTDYNVLGDSYTLTELDPGYYKARLGTNCSSGETSTLLSEVLFQFKIIDLSTAGRIPKNPVAVEDCEKIDYKYHEWVGFEVIEIATGVSNLFEFKFVEGKFPSIKRVLYNHPIVAVDDNGKFPTNVDPHLKSYVPFRMDDLGDDDPNDLVNIGFVICSANDFPSQKITLCKDDSNQNIGWKPEYLFRALVAEGVFNDFPPGGTSNDKTSNDTINYAEYKAQNPFTANLNIFAPQISSRCSNTIIRILNTNGQEMMVHIFDFNVSKISLPVASLLPGIYILQIKTECKIQTIKIVKSE
jgi:Secretion system C-terminal sorting domain